MSSHPVRLSIIVATKDRYETLFDCVQGLLVNYGGPEVEIIVRDNSAQSRAQEFQVRFGDRSSVVYLPDPTPVSQSENYELAMAEARGDYITMIGDDDGISWGLLELADWMDRHGVDAIFPGFSVYLWPGVNGRFAARTNNTGTLTYDSRQTPIRLVDADRERAKVLAGGCTSLEELPRLYYGLVRRHCQDLVRQKGGQVFPGPSPDMANAFSLSYHVATFVVAQLPIFIAGNSRKSNAGLGLRGQHVGEIADLPFLPQDTAKHWNHDIPSFWSGQTIWCQSACTAATAMGRREEFDRMNGFRSLYARLLVFQPRHFDRTLRAFRHRHAGSSAVCRSMHAATIAGQAAWLWVARVAGFLQRRVSSLLTRPTGQVQVAGLSTVSASMLEVDRVMRNMHFESWLESEWSRLQQGRAWPDHNATPSEAEP